MTIQLVGREGPYTGSCFVLERGEHIVGRRLRCAVALPEDKKVSREHAVIDVGRHYARLTDAGSRNGSFVNNQRVIEQILEEGDLIRFGDTVFEVKILFEESGEVTSSSAEPLPQLGSDLGPALGQATPPPPKTEATPPPPPAQKEPPVPRLCPNCGEQIPPNQTYGVCAFCACNLMPIFKGLVRVQRDASGIQQLNCNHCGSLIGDYSQMACPVCRLNFVTGRLPDGTAWDQTAPPPEPPPREDLPLPSESHPPSPAPVRRGCGGYLVGCLLGGFVLWMVCWFIEAWG
jgi:pSer/pThr/pTyr-binding forkhead associated (FHA) protein